MKYDAQAVWPAIAALIEKLPELPGCWIFTGVENSKGYGRYSGWLTHRASYSVNVGPIPPGLQVLHKCDVPACVRPDHLFVGTHQENMADRNRKGRQARGLRMGCHTMPERRPLGEDSARARLTWEQVQEIRRRRAAGEGVRALAREYGVNSGNFDAHGAGKDLEVRQPGGLHRTQFRRGSGRAGWRCAVKHRYQLGVAALVVVGVLFACSKSNIIIDVNQDQSQGQTVSGPSTPASPAAPQCTAVNAAPGTVNDARTLPQGGSLEIGVSPIDAQGGEITNAACLSQFTVTWVPVAGPCTYSAGTPSYANAPLTAPVDSVCKANAILSGPGGSFTRPLPDLRVVAGTSTSDGPDTEPEPSPEPTPFGVIDR